MGAKSLHKRGVYIFNSLFRFPLVLLLITVGVVIVLCDKGVHKAHTAGFVVCIIVVYKLIGIRESIIIVLGILIAFFTISNNKIANNHISAFLNFEQKIIGEVTNYPYTQGYYKIIVFKPAFVIEDKSKSVVDGGLIRVKVSKFYDINKGQKLLLEGFLEEPPVYEGFDYKEYLKINNVYGLINRVEILEVIDSKNENVVYSFINKIRESIIIRIRRKLPEPHAALLLGILIGTREEFPGDFSHKLSITGTTHIIAVSGYNVSVLLMLILSLSGFLPRKIVVIIAYLFLILFSLLVGTDNLPAMRAAIMGGAVLFGTQLGRKSSVYSMIALSALFLIVQNPKIYKSLSFQLSFASTLGLVLLSGDIQSVLPQIFGENLREELSVTMSAILTTFPITFSKFGSLSVWALLTNILVAPLIPYIMLFGFIMIIFSYITFKLVETLFSFWTWLFLELMIKIINRISTLPFSEITVNENLQTISVVYILILIGIILEINYRSKLDDKKTAASGDY